MSRRIKYKIGDVFTINLEDGLYGVGRVLKKYETTAFICIYKMKPISEEQIDMKAVLNLDVLDMTWCYDTFLKNNEWKIIGNVPVDLSFQMPDFSTEGIDGKFYLIKGCDTPDGEPCERHPEITFEEYQRLYSYGIAFPLAVKKGYIMRLKNRGLM